MTSDDAVEPCGRVLAVHAVVAMSLAIVWTPSYAAGRCPPFAGQEWEFAGHLVNRVFPGPPDYESVTSGDEPITRWYLQLPWPACFAEYRYLARFQLSLEPDELDRYRHLLGKQVKVKGTLEEGSPGRHTTSLIINVSSIARWKYGTP